MSNLKREYRVESTDGTIKCEICGIADLCVIRRRYINKVPYGEEYIHQFESECIDALLKWKREHEQKAI